jgi:short-subunit dehydrogenase
MTTLIIGGSSGLGLALAKEFADGGDKVIVTGRKKPNVDFADFKELDLSIDPAANIKSLIKGLPKIDRIIHSAGFYQFGRITDLSNDQIQQMISVTGVSLIYLMREILTKQDGLDELVVITSSSQWTPRKNEPVYNFVKAGTGHFANSMAEDGRVKKVLVVGPSGMRTEFWDDFKPSDLDKMLDKAWVAKQITQQLPGKYKYKFIKILRQPARVEVADER